MNTEFIEIDGSVLNLNNIRRIKISQVGFQQGTEVVTVKVTYLNGDNDEFSVKEHLARNLKDKLLGNVEKVESVERIEPIESNKKDNGKHKGNGIKKIWKR